MIKTAAAPIVSKKKAEAKQVELKKVLSAKKQQQNEEKKVLSAAKKQQIDVKKTPISEANRECDVKKASPCPAAGGVTANMEGDGKAAAVAPSAAATAAAAKSTAKTNSAKTTMPTVKTTMVSVLDPEMAMDSDYKAPEMNFDPKLLPVSIFKPGIDKTVTGQTEMIKPKQRVKVERREVKLTDSARVKIADASTPKGRCPRWCYVLIGGVVLALICIVIAAAVMSLSSDQEPTTTAAPKTTTPKHR